MLENRLAQQGMKQLGRAGPTAIAPEQPGVHDPLDLGRFRRRQGLDVLQPGMAPPGVFPARPAAPQRRGRHGPDGMPGPPRHRGDVAWIHPTEAEPLESIRRHQGVGSLKEDRVSALSGEQAARSQVAGPRRDRGVVNDVEAVQPGPDADAKGGERFDGDRSHRLVDAVQFEAKALRDGAGVSPLVALGAIVVKVEEGGPVRQSGLDKAAGHDRRVEPAGDLGDDPRVRLGQPCRRFVDDLDHRVRPVVPTVPWPIEAAGAPERDYLHGLADYSQVSRTGGPETHQQRSVVEKLHPVTEPGDRSPVDRRLGGKQHVEAFRYGVRDEDGAVAPPPYGVQLAGRRTQDRKAPVVRAPDKQIAPPPLPQRPPGDFGIGTAVTDMGGQGGAAPEPAPENDMATMDLYCREGRARPEPEGQVVDLERPPPARARKPPTGDRGRPTGLRVLAGRMDEEVGMAIQGRVAHRTRIGVKATSRSTSSLRQTSSCCTQQWAAKGQSRTPKTQSALSPPRRRKPTSMADRVRQTPSIGSQVASRQNLRAAASTAAGSTGPSGLSG